MHKGQGKPLPAFTGLEGEWIEEFQMFMYHEKEPQGPTFARLPRKIEFTDNRYCIGFDSDHLAATLAVDRTALIAANKTGSLVFLGLGSAISDHTGTRMPAYGFRLGDKEGFLSVETSHHEGTA